jgi:putative peptidoglycan lipid II flippase
MVDRALRFLTRELGGLHEAAFLLGFFALLSQVAGLVRDRLLAGVFGAGSTLDVYYAAFRVPDLLYVSIASCVASTALIPLIYAREREGEKEDVERYLSRVLTTFALAMVVVGAGVYFLIPYLSSYLVPGFTPEMKETYTNISRILLLSPFLLGISNLFGSVTQSSRRFFSYALAPILYNGGILVGVILLAPKIGIVGVAYGVILGALLHVAIQVPTLVKVGLLPRLTGLLPSFEIRELLTLSLPRTIGLAIHQIAMIVLIALASRIEVGSIAIFTLATNLQNIPLMIIGSSYAVAAFPTLAKLYDRGASEKFLDQLLKAVRHIIFWSAPAIVLFIVIRAQIVRVVLGSGAFDWTATRLTAAALALFMFSLIAHSLILLFARGYYAMGNTRVPLWCNSIGAIFMIISSFILLHLYQTHVQIRFFFEDLFRVEDVSGTEILMIPLSYSLGMILSMTLYFFHLRKLFPQAVGQTRRTLLHAASASVFAGYVAYHTLTLLAPILDTDTFMGVLIQGVSAGAMGLIGWGGLLKLMGSTELTETLRAFKNRLWKTARPIAGEQEEL